MPMTFTDRTRKLVLATGALVCAMALMLYTSQIAQGFVARGMTERVLGLAQFGSVLFLVAIAFSFARPKMGAVAAALGALSGLPLAADFAMPLLFRRVFQQGEPAESFFYYFAGDPKAWLLMLLLLAMLAFCARELPRRPSSRPACCQ